MQRLDVDKSLRVFDSLPVQALNRGLCPGRAVQATLSKLLTYSNATIQLPTTFSTAQTPPRPKSEPDLDFQINLDTDICRIASKIIFDSFLSRVSTLTRVIDVANLSVCPSVRPLRSGILWKRLKVVLQRTFFITGRPARSAAMPIVFTQWSKNGFFAPQGRHVVPINVKFLTGERLRSAPPCQISRLSGRKCGNTAPKTVKISNFGQKFVLQGRFVCNIFTKFSAFVRVYK